ncbi:uncharacterized protein LOC128961506 [Oppia nitens]|uniref:uncharacterized protein LOC128961506 n=1 Tax=Oppia nitens TaxID=1686743 RepID=UPI0023DC8C31|nr:uncharacterized protein LOC128961506 [Oppia nitens]
MPCATPSASTRLSSVGSSREAFATQKSASFDLVDACTQANLSCDVITYDSDDEMVKSRRGIPFGGLRNKKGHPIYSREDIREQYCITRKELDVLDRTSSAARLFGCLSSHHLPDSHCNKNSFLLLSCVQRRKNSSEFDEESDSGLKSKSGIDEEDSSDGGFKQRLKSTHPITRTVKQTQSNCNCNNNVNFHNNTSDKQLYSRQNTQFYSNYGKERNFRSFDSDYSYETHLNSPLKRPTELQLINNSETSDFNTTTSYSVGQLNDRQSSDGSLWKSSNITSITSDDNRNLSKKHVTFATSHLVRSATVGGINNIHTSPPTQPISERLVNESIQINGTHMMRKTDSMDSFEQMLATSSRMSDILPLYQKAMRRAVMKTQATQTDTTNEKPFHRSNRRTIPDYLTLSPRSTKPESTEELYAEYYESDAEDGEEDILQISLKEKKLRKISKSRVVDKSKQKNRRKLRSISKISPKTQSVDIQTNLEELSFQRLDSSYSESSRLETAIKIEDLSSKSSTDSNQLKSESEMSSTTNEFNSIDSYHSIQSQDSTTVVSELNDSIITNEDKQQLFDEINEVFIVTTDVTKRPLIIDPKKNSLRKSLDSSITSPESDNYSFGTEIKPYLTTELSAQGSDNVDSGGSSVYVSANETSPQIATDKTVSGQTSYETASSGSRYSSPPSMENRGSDRELDYNTQVLDICDNVNTESKSLIISKVDNTSNQLKDYIISTEIIEANDGKDRTLTPDSTISTHYSTEHNIDDFDSEDVGDVTPVQDLSTDTSTAIETQTVIENIIKSSLKPKIPPKPTFLLGDQRINVTKERPILSSNNNTDVVITSDNTTSEECDQQSDDNEEVIDDMSGGDFIVRRNMSGELSTVSEVSEEMSTNGKSYVSDSGSGIQMSFIDKKTPNINNDLNQTDISESGDMHSNTPSIAESTTSGSFMIDGNITEPNSLSENIERPKIEKSGSFPSILNDNNNKSFFMDESVVSDKMIDNIYEKRQFIY